MFAVFFVCVTFLDTIVEINLAEVITKPSKLAVERKTEKSRASEQLESRNMCQQW